MLQKCCLIISVNRHKLGLGLCRTQQKRVLQTADLCNMLPRTSWTVRAHFSGHSCSNLRGTSAKPSRCWLLMACRKPLTQREVAIIRRLKKELELPVTHIAKAVER